MPHEGMEFVARKDLLTYEEMVRLTRIMVELGVTKVRITGGEPFVRKNMYGFLKRLTAIDGELATEPERIRNLYQVKASRIEPVGLVYLWPVTG